MIIPRNSLNDRLTSFDITGGSQAENTVVPPFRLERESVIEGRDSVDQALGKVQLAGNGTQRGVLEIAIGILRRVQCLDEGVGSVSIFTHGRVDHAPSFFVC